MKLHTVVIDLASNEIARFETDQSLREDRIRTKMLIDKHLNQGHFVISHRDKDELYRLVFFLKTGDCSSSLA